MGRGFQSRHLLERSANRCEPGRRAPRRRRRTPPRSAGRRHGHGRGRGGRTPRSRRPSLDDDPEQLTRTGLQLVPTPTPGSSVSSSSTPGSSQKRVRAAGRPAARRGAARDGPRAGRAGCGRRTRRRGRRRRRTCPARPEQVLLRDRHRDVVVPALDAPVAGQPAAAAEPGDAGAASASSCASADQPMTEAWWQCGCATISSPPSTAAPSRAWRRAARRACGCPGDPLGGRPADQLQRLAAQRGGARRLHPHDRHPGVDQGEQRLDGGGASCGRCRAGRS